jgi:hypothetical protein
MRQLKSIQTESASITVLASAAVLIALVGLATIEVIALVNRFDASCNLQPKFLAHDCGAARDAAYTRLRSHPYPA